MDIVSIAHFDINTALNIVCMQIEYKEKERKGKNRSADLTLERRNTDPLQP